MRTRSLKVIDMAVHQVATTTPQQTIHDCALQMRREHVGSLVVVDEDAKPIGMITDRDITIEGVALGRDLNEATVGDLMTTENEGMVMALARMRENGIRRLPIVDDSGRLVGVVTNSNLIKELSELLDGLVRNISSSKTREVALRSE